MSLFPKKCSVPLTSNKPHSTYWAPLAEYLAFVPLRSGLSSVVTSPSVSSGSGLQDLRSRVITRAMKLK